MAIDGHFNPSNMHLPVGQATDEQAFLLAEILRHDSLEDLSFYLQSQPVTALRTGLFELFDAHAEYQDADQWAAAVRICESLAIVGWASRERVDAISHFNGDCWDTRFVTENEERRFREGRWTKRKSGWALFNPEYHASPDFPGKPSMGWQHFAKINFAVVDRPNLPSQRNYRKQMPIVMGRIGGTNATSEIVARLKRELTSRLRDAMRPSVYGDAVERFYFTLHCPALAESGSAQLMVGAYNSKQKSFDCDLHFDLAFAELPPSRQREYFAVNLMAAIDSLESKLKTRGIEYDIAGFRSDVALAIASWQAPGSIK